MRCEPGAPFAIEVVVKDGMKGRGDPHALKEIERVRFVPGRMRRSLFLHEKGVQHPSHRWDPMELEGGPAAKR